MTVQKKTLYTCCFSGNYLFLFVTDISCDGESCETTVACAAHNPCWNSGVCLERKDGSLACTCEKGFVGRFCQKSKLVGPYGVKIHVLSKKV